MACSEQPGLTWSSLQVLRYFSLLIPLYIERLVDWQDNAKPGEGISLNFTSHVLAEAKVRLERTL